MPLPNKWVDFMFSIRHTTLVLATIASFMLHVDVSGQEAGSTGNAPVARLPRNILHFHDSVKVLGHVVRLGDLAVVSLADTQRQEYLSSLVLYSAPAPGATRQVRARQVHEELLLRNVDLDGIELRGASRVAVSRTSSQELPDPAINRIGEPAATKSGATKPGATKPGATKSADTSKTGSVVVLTRALRRGERVGKFDVKVVPTRTLKLRNLDPVLDIESVVGRELSRSVDAGDAIDRGWVVEPILVKRGAIVSVIVRIGGVMIRTTARSQQNGTIHDIILMDSLTDRKKTLTGRVVGIDQVEILAQGSTYEPIREPIQREPQDRQRVSSVRR